MSFLRKNGELVFISSQEVVTYYTMLIDELTPQLIGITLDDYRTVRTEIADLRRELVRQLKNFGHRKVDAYFQDAINNAESDQELYALSNAYEVILMDELARIKKKLHTLRTT